MKIEEFARVQDHNHEIMKKVTELEQLAFTAIAEGEMEKFNSFINQIDELQGQYIKYSK